MERIIRPIITPATANGRLVITSASHSYGFFKRGSSRYLQVLSAPLKINDLLQSRQQHGIDTVRGVPAPAGRTGVQSGKQRIQRERQVADIVTEGTWRRMISVPFWSNRACESLMHCKMISSAGLSPASGTCPDFFPVRHCQGNYSPYQDAGGFVPIRQQVGERLRSLY